MTNHKIDEYEENGYHSRKHYLECVVKATYALMEEETDYDTVEDMVLQTAQLLGPTEDFDGLLALIADMSGEIPHPYDFVDNSPRFKSEEEL